jgi:L-lactate utilization protein LutC
MNSRDKILTRLRANERPEAHPPAWASGRSFPDLAERFTTVLTAVGGEVIRAGSLQEALGQVETILHELKAERVVANNVPPLNHVDLPGRWPTFDWHVVGQTPGDIKSFCAGADIGLSGADAALAETGSVVVSSGPGRSRLATLLPPVHLALVSTSQLTSDLFTWTAARSGDLPANVVLVSGPSKTADIEQVLAIGVHGPKRFIVVLYEDD